MFNSKKQNINDFLRMAQLLSFLETSKSKEDKVLEIKMARNDEFISEEEAIELAIEFC